MNRTAVLFAAALLVLAGGTVWAANGNGAGHGYGHRVGGFVDENGDGFNDLAPDADGDGIPNGIDPDYQRPQDGSGPGGGNGTCPYGKNKTDSGNGQGNGPGLCPQAPGGGQFGGGICDGTGPKGRANRGQR